MIYSRSSLILLCLTLATTTIVTSYAQDLPRLPITRCDDLLTPLIGEQVLVFDSQTYEHIQNHSISQLARQLRDKNISLDFNV